MSKPRVKIGHDGSMVVMDGLENVVNGMGTANTQSHYDKYKFDYSVQWPELEAAFQDNWIARQIVELPVLDMLREWRNFTTKEDTGKLEEGEKHFDIRSILEEILVNGRLYGGSGAVAILKGQKLSDPLDIESIKKGDLERFEVVSAANLTGNGDYEINLLSPNYMLPKMYLVKGTSEPVHHTRVIRDFGEYLPKNLRMNMHSGWGDSTLRKCFRALKGADSAYEAAIEMMKRCNYDILKIEGLRNMLSTGSEQEVMKRLQLHGMSMSAFGFSFTDKEGEEIERLSYAFGGIADMLGALNTFLSGAADIPVVRLFGTSAKGMNATGEGDLKNYYDSLAGKQESKGRKLLTQLDEIWIRSWLGYMPDDYGFDWNPLQQPSSKEIAEANLANMNHDAMAIDAGVLHKYHVVKRLQQTGDYVITDEEVEAAKKESEDLGWLSGNEQTRSTDPNEPRAPFQNFEIP